MPPFADGSQKPAIAGIAGSVARLVLTWLDQRVKVVEHQQARPVAQDLQQHAEARGFALRWHNLLVGQEADRPCRPFAGRQCIAEAAPVHALEARGNVLCHARGKCRLADAPHAQHRHQPTALLQDPSAKRGQLLGAVNKSKEIRRLAPVCAPLDSTTFSCAHAWRSWKHVARQFGYWCWSRAVCKKPGEPYLVERRTHPR